VTLRSNYEQLVKHYEHLASKIESASTYTDRLRFGGNSWDSSPYASECMGFVRRAEKKFIDEHKKDILKLAAQLVIEEIG
jgi:hypothetical protein